jgi:hypothetical protein
MVMPIMTAGSKNGCLHSDLYARVRFIKSTGCMSRSIPAHTEATFHKPATALQISFDRFDDLRNITRVSVSGILITLSLPDH